MVNRAELKSIISLAEHALKVAQHQAQSPPTTQEASSMPDSQPESTIHARVSAMDKKLDDLTATIAAFVAKPSKDRLYSVVASGARPPKTTAMKSKPPPLSLPDQLPVLRLQQLDSATRVEMESNLDDLAERINRHLAEACDEFSIDVFEIRALRRNVKSGEIGIQFNSPADLANARLLAPTWCPALNPDLGLKKRLFNIIVHGV